MLGLMALAGLAVATPAAWVGATPANLTQESPSGATLAADKATLLVDIRSPEEWQETGVVEGALLVTYTDADSFLQAVRPHLAPGQKLALICRSGRRSGIASSEVAPLVDMQVVDVAGGMQRLLAEGYAPVAPTAAQGCPSC
ncbi:rhodanese-like domain-containing protein [Rhodobacter ferrooxidans]|nr:rhodanese-like domain-containing protein [Rhodobacter sp. SW2]